VRRQRTASYRNHTVCRRRLHAYAAQLSAKIIGTAVAICRETREKRCGEPGLRRRGAANRMFAMRVSHMMRSTRYVHQPRSIRHPNCSLPSLIQHAPYQRVRVMSMSLIYLLRVMRRRRRCRPKDVAVMAAKRTKHDDAAQTNNIQRSYAMQR
jgi:hypothetical protein